jgi:hypothetical protein
MLFTRTGRKYFEFHQWLPKSFIPGFQYSPLVRPFPSWVTIFSMDFVYDHKQYEEPVLAGTSIIWSLQYVVSARAHRHHDTTPSPTVYKPWKLRWKLLFLSGTSAREQFRQDVLDLITLFFFYQKRFLLALHFQRRQVHARTHTHTHRYTCNHTISVRLVRCMTCFSTKMYVHTLSHAGSQVDQCHVTVTLCAWVCDGSPEHRVTDIDNS